MNAMKFITQITIVMALIICCGCQHSDSAVEPESSGSDTKADSGAFDQRTYSMSAFTDFEAHKVVDAMKAEIVAEEWNEDDHLIGLSGKTLTITTTIANHEKIGAYIKKCKAEK